MLEIGWKQVGFKRKMEKGGDMGMGRGKDWR